MSKTAPAPSAVEAPSFSLSATQTPEIDASAREQLDAALNSFASNAPIMGTVNGQPAPQLLADTEETEQTATEETGEETEETETAEEEETEEELRGFDQEFTKRFGVKPDEAVEIINSLSAFRDEMNLMRNWGVSPTEYDTRMTQVREFYKTLPEDKQPEFNNPEGAKAIWEHLEKTNPSKKKSSTVSKVGSSKKPTTTAKPKEFIKKSEILRMSAAEHQRRLPEINLAWQQGRVIEDV